MSRVLSGSDWTTGEDGALVGGSGARFSPHGGVELSDRGDVTRLLSAKDICSTETKLPLVLLVQVPKENLRGCDNNSLSLAVRKSR